MTATVYVCLGCERDAPKPFTCECWVERGKSRASRMVSMSLLAWELRQIEAVLIGVPCARGDGRCRRKRGYRCNTCNGLDYLCKAMAEAERIQGRAAVPRIVRGHR